MTNFEWLVKEGRLAEFIRDVRNDFLGDYKIFEERITKKWGVEPVWGETVSRVFADWLQAERKKPNEYVNLNKENRGMKIKLDNGAFLPTRAHAEDAGLDIYSPETVIVSAKESACIDTGVHIEIPRGFVGFLKSRSGLNVKYGITSEGVIDAGYTGSIRVKLYNNSGYDYTVHKGDKITQLVILSIITPDIELVNDLEETERGNNGFGSTGK